MSGRHEFEYAIIRLVPKVEREEFLNVGVILYCRAQHFLQVRYQLDENKLTALACKSEPEELKAALQSFVSISEGGKGSGVIGTLGQAERFRWLTATRSTMVQTSQVHPGFCHDAAETLEKLYKEMVL